MKIPDAKAAVNKKWDKLRSLPAWDDNKVKPKAVVVHKTKMEGKTVHFANLMDLCHLKNAELARNLLKHIKSVWCSGGTTSKTNVDTVLCSQSTVLQHLSPKGTLHPVVVAVVLDGCQRSAMSTGNMSLRATWDPATDACQQVAPTDGELQQVHLKSPSRRHIPLASIRLTLSLALHNISDHGTQPFDNLPAPSEKYVGLLERQSVLHERRLQ